MKRNGTLSFAANLGLLVLTSGLLWPGRATGDSLNLRLVGSWPFDGHSAYLPVQSRNALFLGSGGGVLILDITDPAHMQLVSDRLRTGGVIRAMAYDSLTERLFLAGEKMDFEVWDVSNLSNPNRLGSCHSPFRASGIALNGSYACVSDHDSSLRIISIANPANPQQVGRYVAPDDAQGVAAAGQYAYVADGSAVRIVDVSNPASPFEASHLDSTVSSATSIGLRGTDVFISNGGRGLLSIDVSNPALPHAVGSCGTLTYALDMALCDSYAFVTEELSGGEIINVADPAHPVTVGGFAVYAGGVSAYGHYACGAGTELHLFDATGDSLPREIGIYHAPQLNGSCAISGRYAYLGSDIGLRVIDISDLQYTREVGSCAAGGADFKIRDGFAYTPCSYDFVVIDVSDPLNPRQVGWCNVGDMTERVALTGSLACIAAQNSVPVVDISDPANPNLLGTYDSLIGPEAIAARDSIVYVAEIWEGLRIISIADPAHPVQVGHLVLPDYPSDIALSWPYAYIPYLGFSDSGLSIVDVSDPTAPREVGRYQDSLRMDAIAIQGSYAYVLGYSAGLRVLDISDPVHPQRIAYHDDIGVCISQTIAPVGRYIYVPTPESGLLIFENQLYGITEIGSQRTEPAGVQLLQNPARGGVIGLSFDLTEASDVSFCFYDVTGRRALPVYSEHLSRGHHLVRIPAANLATGAYFIKTNLPVGGKGRKVIFHK